MKKRHFLIALLLFFCLCSFAYAGIINYGKELEERWKDACAYRPYSIVFSHGFGSGGPLATWVERDKQKESEKPKLDEKFVQYFNKYFYGHVDPLTQKPIKALQYSRFPYLELVSYIDFTKNARSQLIDRNSSIDTYQESDYYVKTSKKMAAGKDEKRAAGDAGWADKLNAAVEKIRENYTDRNGSPLKINLVGHSMGGLSVREYLTKSKYGDAPDKVSKVIMTGVPNLGSPFASFEVGINRMQKIGWFIPGAGWLFSSLVKGIDKLILERKDVDIDGDAAKDMDVGKGGSGFLTDLNGRPHPRGVDYYVIWGNSHSLDTLLGRQLCHGDGDGVIAKDSQLGTGVLNLKGAVEINASHGTEPREIGKLEMLGVDQAGNAKPLLKFIDSTKPELKITSPDPDKTTEINENTINIKGTVSKEYFPADSILKIEVVRQEDGKSEAPIEGKLLYPSDLWVPSDSDSVVAEFDEPITFSQSGTYKVSCGVKNPAGISSDIKEILIKVVSEISYVGCGQFVSAIARAGNWGIITDFSREEFSEKLLEGKDIAAANCKDYHGGLNEGLKIIWQGGSDGCVGVVDCLLRTAQTVNFKMSISEYCTDCIPLYVQVRIKSSYVDSDFRRFIKLVHLEINGQKFELSEADQKAIYYGGEKSLDFWIPYTEDVSVTYSFDPYIYTLDDEPIFSSPDFDSFSLWAGTRFEIIGVYAMGLCPAKQ